jgi:hypothetical protein
MKRKSIYEQQKMCAPVLCCMSPLAERLDPLFSSRWIAVQTIFLKQKEA